MDWATGKYSKSLSLTKCLVFQRCFGTGVYCCKLVLDMLEVWLSLTTNLQIVNTGMIKRKRLVSTQCMYSCRLVPILGMISSSPHTSWYFSMSSSQHPNKSTRWELPLRFADQDGRWCGNQTRMGLLCRGQWLFGGMLSSQGGQL